MNAQVVSMRSRTGGGVLASVACSGSVLGVCPATSREVRTGQAVFWQVTRPPCFEVAAGMLRALRLLGTVGDHRRFLRPGDCSVVAQGALIFTRSRLCPLSSFAASLAVVSRRSGAGIQLAAALFSSLRDEMTAAQDQPSFFPLGARGKTGNFFLLMGRTRAANARRLSTFPIDAA